MKNTKLPSPLLCLAAVLAATANTFSLSSVGANVEYTEPFEWTLDYDGSALPLEAGSVQYDDATTGAFHGQLDDPDNLNAQILDGVLEIDSEDRGVFAIDAGQEDRFLLNSDVGYTAEFRARLIKTVNLTDDRLNINGACLQLNDGRADVEYTVHLGLMTDTLTGENYARVRAGALSPAVLIGEEFRTYTFVVAASEVSFYVDGYHVADLPPWVIVDRPEVWLGTFQSGANHVANFEVDYLKIYDGGAVHPVENGSWEANAALLALSEPRPEIVGFGEDAGDFALSFNTIIGGNYVVESRDDLEQASPNEPSAQVTGTGGVVTSRDSMTGVNRRFYQVAREPEEIVYEEAFDWDFRYEGDADPLSAGAIEYSDNSTGGFDVFRTVAGKYRNDEGVLLLEFPLEQTEGGTFDITTNSWEHPFVVDIDVGYTLEYRARVDYSLHYGAAILEINPSGGGHHAVLGLVTTTVDVVDEETEEVIGTESINLARLQSAAGNVLTDYPLGTGFNTFTLLGERERVTLFINGVEVASTENIRTNLAREFLRFGSATGAANTSRYDVDYIRIHTGGAVRPESPLGE